MPDVHSPGSTPLGFVLDRSSREPLHHRLSQQLKRAVEQGHLAPGTLLSSENRMAEESGLSRLTVRRAIQSLADAGLLVRRRGIGTLVAHGGTERPLDLADLHDDLQPTGRGSGVEVLRNETEPASAEVAAALAIAEGSEVTVLERLRHADGIRIAYWRSYLPAGFLRSDNDRLESAVLFEMLQAAGIDVHSAQQTIGARHATAGERKLLGVTEGSTLLTLRRTMVDHIGRVIEYATHCYPPSRADFAFHLVIRPYGPAVVQPDGPASGTSRPATCGW
ncbi:GntR family transcriptional regulator [Streptomyces sp. NPDC001795]|uniref:GntR family transcriptional regulator n=1 Tax=unclassified Streptomyces TaxID=2593676 RepID=UPI00332CC95F